MASDCRILFGGTFDPPHLGHQELIGAAKAYHPSAILHVIPSLVPPLRDGEKKDVLTSYEHRLAMCKLAFAHPIEADLTGNKTLSYTVDQVKWFHERYPSDQLILLIGQDQLENFSNWRAPIEILELANLLIAPRTSDLSLDAAITQCGEALNLNLIKDQARFLLKRRNGTTGYMEKLPMMHHDARSSELRLAMVPNELHPAVYQYIQKHHLYMNQILTET
jgi:nicotinate-nucleotide adenylyltransferase